MTLFFGKPTMINDHPESRKSAPKTPEKTQRSHFSIGKLFKLNIKPIQSKARRPKNELAESEKEWLKNVLDKPNITYITPCRKDHRYVGKLMVKARNDVQK